MNTATKNHDGYTMLPTVPPEGMPVHVNDMACITHELKQYRHPKQKSHRRVKKWAKNRKNYRMEEQHRAFEMQGKLFVSTKIFKQLTSLIVPKNLSRLTTYNVYRYE